MEILAAGRVERPLLYCSISAAGLQAWRANPAGIWLASRGLKEQERVGMPLRRSRLTGLATQPGTHGHCQMLVTGGVTMKQPRHAEEAAWRARGVAWSARTAPDCGLRRVC